MAHARGSAILRSRGEGGGGSGMSDRCGAQPWACFWYRDGGLEVMSAVSWLVD